MSSAAFHGPWDLRTLKRTPQCEWGERLGLLQQVYYANEPYCGAPTRVFGYYGSPKDATGRAPAMVLVHGGGGKAFPEWAQMWAERGYAALAMDLGGRGPDGARLPDGMPEQDDQAKFSDVVRGVKETWSYHAVAGVIRGASLLAARPDVDPDRIGITGISWGGYLTCIVAGLDDRLKLAVPVYGCGFLHHNSCWLPTFEKMPPGDRELWLNTFEPSLYLPGAHMPTLWVNGTNDFAYPLDSYQKSNRLPRGPRTLCVTVGMAHGHEPGWAPLEIGLFADACLHGGTPLPRIGAMQADRGQVSAQFESPTRIVTGGLHYTADRGAWPERKWFTLPAEVLARAVSAHLPPQRPIVFFVTITDERGATVSTEYSEIAVV